MYCKGVRTCMQNKQIDDMNEQFPIDIQCKYEFFKEIYDRLANFTLTYTSTMNKYQTDK